MSAPYPTDNRQFPPYPNPAAPYQYPNQAGPYPPPQPPIPNQGQGFGFGGYQGGQPNIGFMQPPQQPFPGSYSQQPGYSEYPQQPGFSQPQPEAPWQDDSNYKAADGFGFDDKTIRAGFIRRVYSILSLQLLVTLGFVSLMVLHQETQNFVKSHSELMAIPLVGSIVLLCIIACCENARRTSPLNIILLGAFTLFESLLVGFISSTYKPKIVLLAVGLTAAIVLGLTLFAFQTRFDFTVCGGALCVVLIIFSVGSIIGSLFFRSDFGSFLIACFGAGLFSIYIVYDTQLMMGGDHKYSISPEEYVFASLNLYMDIIQLFLYLLRILKYLNND